MISKIISLDQSIHDLDMELAAKDKAIQELTEQRAALLDQLQPNTIYRYKRRHYMKRDNDLIEVNVVKMT